MRMFDGIQVDCHGQTDRGKIRPDNQDHFLIAGLHKVIEIAQTSIPQSYRQHLTGGARALLLLVADGVGGGPAGAEASSLTLDTVASYVTNSMRCFSKLDDRAQQELLDELAQTVRESNALVREAAKAPALAGMATTLTMAHVLWPRVYVVQIGDSRCYHLRGSTMRQVTRDQTVAQALVDQGVLSPDAANASPMSHVLTQSIGGSGGGRSEVVAEISKVELERADWVLLCTDGLTKHVSGEHVAETLQGAASARDACERLVGTALDRGGTDNITVVASRFT